MVTVARVLAAGRRAAEARMRDECAFRRKTGSTTDPRTGKITPVYADGYAGPCRVKMPTPQGTPTEAGEAVVVMSAIEVHIPMPGTPVPQVGDECVITSSTGDPALVGAVFIVDKPHRQPDSTARRIGVKERSS
ncbi:DUF6093 family protein [Micromonospora echinospora]|uniref:DUF6093 family protein n=1 Tax=Micromonospora echinospora TaxID=1877 RepID=UPI0037ABBB2B